MLSIRGLESGEAPTVKRTRGAQNNAQNATKSPLRDGLQLSDAAREAAEALKLIQHPEQSEVQAQRIEAAKAQIEAGTYKMQNIVEQVAARISPHIF